MNLLYSILLTQYSISLSYALDNYGKTLPMNSVACIELLEIYTIMGYYETREDPVTWRQFKQVLINQQKSGKK